MRGWKVQPAQSRVRSQRVRANLGWLGSIPPALQREKRERARWPHLLRLLQRYADHDLDQWQLWRLPSEYGDLFVNLRRSPEPGVDVEVYDDATGFLTGE